MSLEDQTSAPAEATPAATESTAAATGTTGGNEQVADGGASSSDVRAVQVEALKAARERDSGEDPAATGKPAKDPTTGKFVSKSNTSGATGGKESTTGAKAEGEEPAADEETPKAETQPSEPPPAHLAPEVKAVWDKLPEDARPVIAARTLEDRQMISRQGNALKQFEPFGRVVQEHSDYFSSNKTHPGDVLGNFVKWDKAIEKDPVNQFPALMDTYGLSKAEAQALIGNISKRYGLDTTSSQPGAEAFDLPPDQITIELQASRDALARQNEALQRQIAALNGTLTAREQAALEAQQQQIAQQEETQLASAIETFRSGKDPAEFEFLRPYIAAEISKLPPTTADKDVLPLAYANAKRQFDGVVQSRVSTVEKDRAEKAAKAAAQAKRAGSINIEGAPVASQASMSVRDEQRAALARARAMNGAAA